MKSAPTIGGYLIQRHLAHRGSFFLIEACLDPDDRSPALQRLTARLGRRV